MIRSRIYDALRLTVADAGIAGQCAAPQEQRN